MILESWFSVIEANLFTQSRKDPNATAIATVFLGFSQTTFAAFVSLGVRPLRTAWNLIGRRTRPYASREGRQGRRGRRMEARKPSPMQEPSPKLPHTATMFPHWVFFTTFAAFVSLA